MKIYVFENGPFMVNTYLIMADDSDIGIILDPGSHIQPLIDEVKKKNFKIAAVVGTHAHIDHIAGVNSVKKEFDVPFYLNSLENEMLDLLEVQARMFGVPNPGNVKVDENLPLDGGISLAGIDFTLFHTPGHSPGSISLYAYDAVFSGDALFQFSIGRTDLPGGDYETLITSIRQKLFTLPDSTKVFSGHGPETSIGFEKKMNPFLK